MLFVLFITLLSSCSTSKEVKKEANQCIGSGPQSPRDIDSMAGLNSALFSKAPALKNMNLCNVHFHRNAEHKSKRYSNFVSDGKHSGWACKKPTVSRLNDKHAAFKGCTGIAEGDTVEVHWVYTSCETKPAGVKTLGKGLAACMTTLCANPQLKVESQVFTLKKNGDFKFNKNGAVSINDRSVSYNGSTTGPSYSGNHCSPLQVSWNVRKSCRSLDINSFAKWCSDNKYGENHAHGVRALVKNKKLLSPIRK